MDGLKRRSPAAIKIGPQKFTIKEEEIDSIRVYIATDMGGKQKGCEAFSFYRFLS